MSLGETFSLRSEDWPIQWTKVGVLNSLTVRKGLDNTKCYLVFANEAAYTKMQKRLEHTAGTRYILKLLDNEYQSGMDNDRDEDSFIIA